MHALHERQNSAMLISRVVLLLLFFLSLFLTQSTFGADEKNSPRFRVESPKVQLNGLPIPRLRIVALTEEGEIDTSFNQQAVVNGVQLTEGGSERPLPEFEAGVLEVRSNSEKDQRLILVGSSISVAMNEQATAVISPVQTRPGWVSLIPPLVAIILAIWWQEVIGALFLASLAGMMLLATNPFSGMIQVIDPLILSNLASRGNMQIILFTMFLGAMIGIMSGSGGTQALVERLTVYVRNRRHGQLMTWLLGLMIFFDDYGNTLLVGSTMRSMMDRLKISREKLAYLVDSTAAPVAGLALVSTWVGVELGYMRTAYESLGLSTGEIYQTFIATIPYRLYPLLTLIFVGQIAWTGRDFGPMLKAEQDRQHDNDESTSSVKGDFTDGSKPMIRHALIPLATLCLCLGIALYHDFEESSRALLLASTGAVFAAVLSVVISRSCSLGETMKMGIDGMQQMLPAVVVLVLAWSIGTVCNPEHLNTAGYLVDSLGDHLSPRWLPLITFLLAAAVSFATGTSYGTMGLLIPLAVSIELQLLLGLSIPFEEIGNHPLMLATIGSILGGAIFGDHCSPISDTTVLSSAATGCDHLSHVRTQLPYALMVATIAICLGYVPIALGISPYISIIAAIIVQWLVLRIIGREVEVANSLEPVRKPLK